MLRRNPEKESLCSLVGAWGCGVVSLVCSSVFEVNSGVKLKPYQR